jgi:glutamine amidotransferase
VKVPHIGWNDVVPIHSSDLFPGAGGVFYFVHSFYLPVSAFAVAKTVYGGEWISAVQRERVFGAQFHPEKSQESGLRTLRAFLSSEGGN